MPVRRPHRPVVALVGLGPRLRLDADLADVQRLTEAGAVLRLVSWAPPSARLTALLDDVVVLGPGRAPLASPLRTGVRPAALPAQTDDTTTSTTLRSSPAPRPRGLGRAFTVGTHALRSPRRYLRRGRQLARQRMRRSPALPVARGLVRTYTRRLLSEFHTLVATAVLLRDPTARSVLRAADVLVAADVPSVLAVKTVASRRRGVPAVLGVAAGVTRLPAVPVAPPASEDVLLEGQ